MATAFFLILLFFIIGFICHAMSINPDWKAEIEEQMHLESLKYNQFPDDKLIDELKNQRWSAHGTIWIIIEKRGNPKFIPYLLKSLSYFENGNHRYNQHHCAHAIFVICRKNNLSLPEELNHPQLKSLCENWNLDYERALEQQKYKTFSEDSLIEEIKAKNWGSYHSIWNAFEKNGSPKSIPYLIEILSLFNPENHPYDFKFCGKAIYILCVKYKIDLPKEIEISYFQEHYETWKNNYLYINQHEHPKL